MQVALFLWQIKLVEEKDKTVTLSRIKEIKILIAANF